MEIDIEEPSAALVVHSTTTNGVDEGEGTADEAAGDAPAEVELLACVASSSLPPPAGERPGDRPTSSGAVAVLGFIRGCRCPPPEAPTAKIGNPRHVRSGLPPLATPGPFGHLVHV